MKYNEDSSVVQYLYVKQHDVRNPHTSLPKGRTLFVLNVPSYVNKVSAERLQPQLPYATTYQLNVNKWKCSQSHWDTTVSQCDCDIALKME